jgi:hypothetical protein
MRVRLSLLCTVVVFAALFGPQTGSGVAQEKRAKPPTAKDLVGVWIGFDNDQLTFTRLDLILRPRVSRRHNFARSGCSRLPNNKMGREWLEH